MLPGVKEDSWKIDYCASCGIVSITCAFPWVFSGCAGDMAQLNWAMPEFVSFAHGFDHEALGAFTVELSVENLLPGAQIQ